MVDILRERERQVYRKGQETSFQLDCEKQSVAGSVSQRACVFCGSRVVLYPIADALHIVHGPIGCASYTWDIRGALSSGPELHRLSFSTDMQEMDIVRGGEKKLYAALCELIDEHHPKAAFVYATCIVGVIGDDVGAVCKRVSMEKGIPVLPVHSDFNLAGETWIIRDYYARMGVQVVSCITGDGRIDEIRRAHGAALNVVQCSGSMTHLAKNLKDKYGIPFIRVSYFGLEDMSKSLYDVARHFGNKEVMQRTQSIVREELDRAMPLLAEYRRALSGKRAAIYVGGAFKAFSLVSALRLLGMKTVMVGSQTGNKEDYEQLRELCDEGTIIADDSNPLELSTFLEEKEVDVFIGGVKERPIAYKLGIGFCDHNHERKEALAGFEGMVNFAREVYGSVMSPVWQLTPRKRAGTLEVVR